MLFWLTGTILLDGHCDSGGGGGGGGASDFGGFRRSVERGVSGCCGPLSLNRWLVDGVDGIMERSASDLSNVLERRFLGLGLPLDGIVASE